MASVNYLQGSERPTAALMNNLFDALDAKLTTLLGGRSFFLAQTTTPPQYLCGKAFFFTSGAAVYARRVPGYIETNTTSNPVARPYNHAQFVSAQATATFQPGYLKSVAIQQPGSSYLLNDVLTAAGGTVAPGGSPAQVQVTSRDASGKIQAVTITNPGSYTVLPPTPNQVNGGHGSGAWLDLNLFQFDLVNKVAPVNKIDSPGTSTPHYAGLPYAAEVGLFEWSLAAHSVLYQGRGDKTPVRYYLQDGSTMPEKHFKFALAEIIIEGPLAVTIEKAWDKYACFRIHNLNPKPATLTFADGNYVVTLAPYQCATVRRSLRSTPTPDGSQYENYRLGGNYFFKFEGGDPRFYWFFPTTYQSLTGTFIGHGGRAANSMQANNLVNAALLYDWINFFQRAANGSTTFAGWNEDATVQCDIYPLLKKLFGDPSDKATRIGDLLHHKGDVYILRRPKKIWRLYSGSFGVVVQNGGKGYAAGQFVYPNAGLAQTIRGSIIQILSVDADGGITSAVTANSYDGYCYPQPPPPFYNQVTGGSGSGAILGLRYVAVNNDLLGALSPFGMSYYGLRDKVAFNGYASITADFAAKQLTVSENLSGNLVIANADPMNDVFLYPAGTNLFKAGETNPAMVDLSGGNTFTVESAIFEPDPENPVLANDSSGGTAGLLSATAPQTIRQPAETACTPKKTYYDLYRWTGAPAQPFAWTVNGQMQTVLDWSASRASALTLNGIHKKTVADLLTLDWWGDPAVPGQTSTHIAIGGRKLTFTPQGLVLTFNEVKSDKLEGSYSTQPSGDFIFVLNTEWLAGKRGIPRDRQFRFRAHGWGFVGVARGGSGAIPPSGTTGIFSPTQGRQEAIGAYRGEVVAPQGVDFDSAWSFGSPTSIKVLTRVEPLNMSTDGRFWKLHGSGIWSAMYPPGGTRLDETGNAVVPGWASYSGLPVMALPLVVEMYNALARAVNSITTGTPLQWQCLFFNVGGFVINLDPTYAFAMTRAGDNAAVSWISGYPFPQLNNSNQFVTGDAGKQYCFYTGPRPMNQFAAFDQSSLYERLCGKLGIIVRTENDLPGGMDETGRDQALYYFQQKYTAPAVYVDFASARSNGDTGCVPADPTLAPNDPSGRGVDQFSGTVTIDLETELLSTASLLAGKATGKRCLGTYDHSKYYAGGGVSLPGFPPPPPAYPDFTNAAPGSYYVADDGSGIIATASGELFLFAELVRAPGAFNGGTIYGKGRASYPGNELWVYHGYGMQGGVDLTTGFTNYRWVQLEDIKRVVESLGFPFFWMETCQPVELKYFEDPTSLNLLVTSRATVSAPWTANTLNYAGNISPHPINVRAAYWQLTDPNNWMQEEIAQINALTASWQNFDNSGLPGHGTLLKFCPTADARRAKWKVAVMPAFGSIYAPDNSGHDSAHILSSPPEVCNVTSRSGLSPLFRYINLGASVGLTIPYYVSSGPMTQWSPSLSLSGTYFSEGNRPSDATGVAQLVAQYQPKTFFVRKVDRTAAQFTDLLATRYTESTLKDQVQTLGFNIYASRPIAALPVLMSGIAVWEKQRDWWGSLDTAYAASGGPYGGTLDFVPWQFVAAAQPVIAQITDYFGTPGQNGLTILSAAPEERYWCCFSSAYFDLNAVTFATL